MGDQRTNMSDLPSAKPKAVGPAVTVEELVAMGVPEKKAKQTLPNLALCQMVADIKAIALQHVGDIPVALGKQLFEIASKMKSPASETLQLVVEMVAKGEISSTEQTTAATKLLNAGAVVDRASVVTDCGVGVTVSEATITSVIERVWAENQADIDAKGHGMNGAVITQVRADAGLTWASGKLVSEMITAKFNAALGVVDKKKMKEQRKKELDAEKKEKVPFLFTQYLQEAFKVPLVIQMTDDEKFLFKEDLELPYVRKCLRENAKDIIALGFDRERTFMFSDIDYIIGGNGTDFYKNILEVQKRCNLNTAQSIFGFGPEHNIGQISFASIQASPSFATSFPHIVPPNARCLIPCAIDQDPYFRMTRAIAPRMKCQKPALIHSKFFPAMTGSQTKMSSSTASPTTIFLTDTPEQIAEKIKKYAFSGAPKTLAEHKEKGANLEVDVSYQYLRFFLEDDAKLQSIGDSYSTGKMMTGEVKAELSTVLQELVAAFQVRRAAVTEEEVDYFMSVDKFKKHQASQASAPANSTADAGVASLEQYLGNHNLEGLLGDAANQIAKDKPADPIAALAAHFAALSARK